MSLIAVLLFWRLKELRWAPALEHLVTLARFGVPLVVHTFAAVLLSSADRWAVSLKLGAEQLGIYGAAAQLGMVMGVSADAFVKAYGPWLYAKLSSDDLEDRRIATGAIFVATPGFFIAAFVLGALLVAVSSFVLGPKYKDAASLVPWFMVGGAFTGTYMSTSSLYFFEGRTGLLSLVTLSSGLMGALATWWLVGMLGLEGAAIGFAITQAILALTVSGVAMASFALPWREPSAAIAAWWKMCATNRGDRPGPEANPLGKDD
jgi:O-antigen/teichoic acid export membrane protein